MAEHGRDVHHRDPAGAACVRVRTALVHAWPPGRGAEGMTRFDNLSVLVTGGGAGQGDVTVAADVARMVAAGNRIDVLVNNAGGGMADDMLEIDEEAWEHE